MSKTPQFEIPTDMRKMTEQSLEQVRTAINGYLQFLRRTVPGNVMGGSELADKILGNISRSRQFDGCEIEIIDGLPDWSSRTSVETAGTGTGNPRRSP